MKRRLLLLLAIAAVLAIPVSIPAQAYGWGYLTYCYSFNYSAAPFYGTDQDVRPAGQYAAQNLTYGSLLEAPRV
ncbi:MAG TPA: hypothetical protein VGK50_06795 [Coriobacteriia bacterium]|jgi:hypothetical protein